MTVAQSERTRAEKICADRGLRQEAVGQLVLLRVGAKVYELDPQTWLQRSRYPRRTLPLDG